MNRNKILEYIDILKSLFLFNADFDDTVFPTCEVVC